MVEVIAPHQVERYPVETENADSKRIIELDCTRRITAFIVVLFHFAEVTSYKAYLAMFAGGTDLFFIISGFVGYNLLRSSPSASEYAKRRFVRLIPTFWACASLTFLCIFAFQVKHGLSPVQTILQYLSNLTLLNFFMGIPFLDGVYWTLLIEVLFYSMLGGLLFLNWGKYLEKAGAVGVLYLFLTSIVPLGSFNAVHWTILTCFPLMVVWPVFYAGIVFNKIKYDGGTVGRWLLLLLAFITNILAVGNSAKIHGVVLHRPLYEHALMTFVYFGFFYLSINNRLRLIVNKVTLFLAGISYCLYLIHMVIGNQFVKPQLKELPQLWQILLMTAIMVLVASLLTYFVERPLVKWVGRKLKIKGAH